ncbi:MAG: hypothetical protein ACOCUL_04560 [Bacteroidota bacterium]
MKKIMQILLLSCFKATSLIEKKIYSRLSIPERIQLRFHNKLCDACFQYEKQSQVIDQVISRLMNKEEKSCKLDIGKMKKEIISKIEEKNNSR